MTALTPGEVTLELYDISAGTFTLLAVGTPAANLDRVIYNVVDATDDGNPRVCYVCVGAVSPTDYQLLIARNADLDTEPNDEWTDPLPAHDGSGVVLGHVGVGERDLVQIALVAGDTLLLRTETPRDHAAIMPRNTLDPALTLYDPARRSVAFDNATEDGKNARLLFTADAAGIYTVAMQAEEGAGEYVLESTVFSDSLPQLRIDDVQVVEGDKGSTRAAFTVSISADPTDPVTVRFDTQDGTATLADADYLPISNLVLTFERGGSLSQEVAVEVSGDRKYEPHETVLARLSNATGAVIADPLGVGDVLNDDRAEVVGRHIFYNLSAFDGDQPTPDPLDDDAVAPDKRALLPGETANLANYTSYSRGINGIIVDIVGLGDPDSLNADDFEFRVGNSNDPDAWATAPLASSIAARPGAGVDDSDRVTVVWPDNAIQNQWLQVTVLPTERTGLAEADVFYFGNLIAEVDGKPINGEFRVGGDDIQAILAASVFPRRRSVPIDGSTDFTRDGWFDGDDVRVILANYPVFGSPPLGGSWLQQITVPEAKVKLDTEQKARPAETARACDAAVKQIVDNEPLLGRLAWLYELEKTSVQGQPTERDYRAEKALDELLATAWA